ncbi:MAG: DUF3574 domain-containing protein [Caldilineaceae bacterium]
MFKVSTYHSLMVILCCAALWVMPARSFSPTPDTRASEPAAASRAPYTGDLWRRTELYFGSQKPDGSAVTAAEFEEFVDEIVTPRFPDGLTLLTGYGQFRNSANVIVEEQSFVMILLYPRDDKEAGVEIEEIRTAYKDTFAQESVLRVDSLERVSF